MDDFDYNSACSEIATLLDGHSGREISKLAVAWQASAYASESGILTKDMMMSKVADSIEQHKRKMDWQADEERLKRTEQKYQAFSKMAADAQSKK